MVTAVPEEHLAIHTSLFEKHPDLSARRSIEECGAPTSWFKTWYPHRVLATSLGCRGETDTVRASSLTFLWSEILKKDLTLFTIKANDRFQTQKQNVAVQRRPVNNNIEPPNKIIVFQLHIKEERLSQQIRKQMQAVPGIESAAHDKQR